MFQLNKKIAVVTGGGSGICKAVALLFAKQGAVVHVIDLNEKGCESTLQEINQAGVKAFMQVCDVTVQGKVQEVFNEIGRVDILVNSAGVSHIGNIENTTQTDFNRIYNINVKGVYNCLQAGKYLEQLMAKTILITGASRGIGASTAILAAQKGLRGLCKFPEKQGSRPTGG